MKFYILVILCLVCQTSEVNGQDESVSIFKEMHSISEALNEEISKTQREIQAQDFNPMVEQKATKVLADIKQQYVKQMADLEQKFQQLETNNANADVDVLNNLAKQYISDAKQILISTEEQLIGEEVDAWWENEGLEMQNKYTAKNKNYHAYSNENQGHNANNQMYQKEQLSHSKQAKDNEVHYMEQKFEGNHGYDEERYAKMKEEYAAMQSKNKKLGNSQAKMWTDSLPSRDSVMGWSNSAVQKNNVNKFFSHGAAEYQFQSPENIEEIAGVSQEILNTEAASETSSSFFHLLFMVCLMSAIIGSGAYYCARIEKSAYSQIYSEAELATLLEGKSHYQSSA